MHVGSSSYIALALGGLIEGGVVEEERETSAWLPYVEVADAREATAHTQALGARIVLEPREGPGGWRSVIAAPDGTEIALWQPKPARTGRASTPPGHRRTTDR